MRLQAVPKKSSISPVIYAARSRTSDVHARVLPRETQGGAGPLKRERPPARRVRTVAETARAPQLGALPFKRLKDPKP